MPDVEKITTYHLTDSGWNKIKEFSESACRAGDARKDHVYDDMRMYIDRLIEDATKAAKLNGFKKGKTKEGDD